MELIYTENNGLIIRNERVFRINRTILLNFTELVVFVKTKVEIPSQGILATSESEAKPRVMYFSIES